MWDLYCGVGVVGLYLSPVARRVYGIDSEAQHLELARWNAQANGFGNVEFRMGAAEAVLQERRFWLQEARPDVVVVDPPRAGLHRQMIASLLAARPRRMIYVSCNAQSLARDLRALLSHYPRYRLTAARAFDLFPQTDHVETVAVLDRAP
jgi:23S rRNA (uracil1939-C5)-methyltransferase